jgi:molecular chaperone HtpG
MRDMIIFKNSEEKYTTLTEYKEAIPENFKEKMEDKVIYFEKDKSDSSLKKQLLAEGIHCLETEEHIDPHFMQHVEMHKKGEHSYKFTAIDSEIENLLAGENTTDTDLKIKDLFKLILVGEDKKEEDKDAAPVPGDLDIDVRNIKNSSSPAYFKIDESMKRLQQMTKSMGNQSSAFPIKKTLVINPNSELIKNAYKIWEKGDNKELAKKLCFHVKDLATISSEGLDQKDRSGFVGRSQELIQELTGMLS